MLQFFEPKEASLWSEPKEASLWSEPEEASLWPEPHICGPEPEEASLWREPKEASLWSLCQNVWYNGIYSTGKRRKAVFETRYYIVQSIDGDYANLINEEDPSGEPKLVARALLPDSISEGCRIRYEMMQYYMA